MSQAQKAREVVKEIELALRGVRKQLVLIDNEHKSLVRALDASIDEIVDLKRVSERVVVMYETGASIHEAIMDLKDVSHGEEGV